MCVCVWGNFWDLELGVHPSDVRSCEDGERGFPQEETVEHQPLGALGPYQTEGGQGGKEGWAGAGWAQGNPHSVQWTCPPSLSPEGPIKLKYTNSTPKKHHTGGVCI